MRHPTLVGHWIICLICMGAFAFAWAYDVPQLVYRSDHSMMTSAIAALVVITSAWLGRQAWLADTGEASAKFGHLAESLAVKFGLIGTGVGIMMTIVASLESTNPLMALRTAFFSMICGVAASALISLMTHNLEDGMIKGSRR